MSKRPITKSVSPDETDYEAADRMQKQYNSWLVRQPLPEDASYSDLSARRDLLRWMPLTEVHEVALHTHQPYLSTVLPDHTSDQLLLKLAFMGETPSKIAWEDGYLIVESSLGQHWFVFDAEGTSLSMLQVL